MKTITVDLARRPYPIHVGAGVLDRLGAVVAERTRARQVLLVTQPPIAEHYLDRALASLRSADLAVDAAVVDDGERAKSPATLERLWSRCAAVPLERRDVVVALGGGVVGDLAGFVAATWNRGIDVIQVPTTLLAQTDAAIGGKTGIDLAHGKNLVGAFHQPAAVIADTDTLATLPPRTLTEGFGEVVKYGLIRDPEILTLLEGRPADAVAGSSDLLADLVERSAQVKAVVVAADEREAGERAHLNLGHTYGHALETLTGYDQYLHGEAVAVGMLVALHLGEAMGLHGPDLRHRTEALLTALGLPTTAPPLDRDDLWSVMARDKKADDGVRFVLLEGLARPAMHRPDRAQVMAAITAVEQA